MELKLGLGLGAIRLEPGVPDGEGGGREISSSSLESLTLTMSTAIPSSPLCRRAPPEEGPGVAGLGIPASWTQGRLSSCVRSQLRHAVLTCKQKIVAYLYI